VLTASGLIAGEALMGLAVAGVVAFKAYQASKDPSVQIAFPQVPGFAPFAGWIAILVMVFLLAYMWRRPLSKAGAPDEPAPPTAVM
jgi:hypothetical protein